MTENAIAALDIIRNQLQVILGRVELCQNQKVTQCDTWGLAVCKIVKEIRTLFMEVKFKTAHYPNFLLLVFFLQIGSS
jgi:hypothetical protein